MLQFLSYYGPERVELAVGEVPGLRYRGLACTTEWVPLFTGSAHLLRDQLQSYATHEASGGLRYHCHPVWPGSGAVAGKGEELDSSGEPALLSATETAARAEGGGEVLCRWQTHLFQWDPFGCQA